MRNFIRHPVDIPIKYYLGDIVDTKHEYLNNISEGGISFRSNIEIPIGTLIAIQIPIVKPVFTTEGIVVWCAPGDNHFDIGVEFTSLNNEFRARMVEQICYIEHYKKEVLQNEGRHLTTEDAAVEWIKKYAKDFPSLD
ncbi:MAG: PilZ domain-containing protein [Spirochaetes bacterium]|nr:PilZ domain-containing protein [Spirochaetota bacterium]MCK5267093.1 PilZ domain-containing protein [Spirochaetota bacterium]